jgi:phosphatidylserine decarboxylase
MNDKFFVVLQHGLPKLAITVFAGMVANWRGGRITQAIIGWFVAKYHVNMAEAAETNIRGYACFNDFFTRALQPGARPMADAAFVSPVDGAISQLGVIDRDQMFQAKGHSYSTQALVGGDAMLAAQFDHGVFATIYLSPKDYHRIHMPSAGRLRRMIHVPGDLFSVNPATARGVPGLFARNERVVCVFDLPGSSGAPAQPFALVLVGATIVGSMATTWHGQVNPPRPGRVREWTYDDQDWQFQQGDEMGRFLLGSTVVMLWPRDTIQLRPDWQPSQAVRLGEKMGD